jgi:hypothetical protein
MKNLSKSTWLSDKLEASIWFLHKVFRRLGIRNFRPTPGRLKPLQTLVALGNWPKLEEAGHELLQQSYPSQVAIEFVAFTLQQAGRLKEAATIAAGGVKLFPKLWIFQFLAGIALKGVNRESEALVYLQQAVAIRPKCSQSRRELTEVIAFVHGIEVAASEYTALCEQAGIAVENICVCKLSSVTDWVKRSGLPWLDAGEVEDIPYKAPHVWGSPPETKIFLSASNKPYVAEIKNARIFGKTSLILTPDGTALSDTATDPKFGHTVSFAYERIVRAQRPDSVLLDFNDFTLREVDAGIFLSGLASDAFGHWLPDFLPKLQFLKCHPDFDTIPIIVDADMPQSHFDHLRRLANNPLILLQANESIMCRRLLVSPGPAFLGIAGFPNDIPLNQIPGISPRALRFIQTGLANITQHQRNRRLFLARKNMTWRRLINEKEIADYLQTLGFETVYLENLSAAEQIELFQQAQFIVGPNGSAMLNLIFSDTSAKLISLSQPNLHNWGGFQGPMDALGYQSLFVCGDFAIAEDQKHSDYHVPLSRILEALSYLGIKDAHRQA